MAEMSMGKKPETAAVAENTNDSSLRQRNTNNKATTDDKGVKNDSNNNNTDNAEAPPAISLDLHEAADRLSHISFIPRDYVRPVIRFGIFFSTLCAAVYGLRFSISWYTTLLWLTWQTIWFIVPLAKLQKIVELPKSKLEKDDEVNKDEDEEEDDEKDEAGKHKNGIEDAQDTLLRMMHVGLAFMSFALVNVTYADPHYHGVFTGGGLLMPLWFLGGVASLCFAVWSRWTLGSQWRGAPEVRDDHKLITSGPYKYTRHPIYTGLLGMLLCCAIYNGTWVNYFAAILGSSLYFYKTQQEEMMLRAHFGKQFLHYQDTTPMLIPTLY